MDSPPSEYQVKKAYNLLLKDATLSHTNQHRDHNIPQEIWPLVWKVKIPVKINTFVWKLLHDSLLVNLILNSKGILANSLCPLCKEADESISHLFLFCNFTRAVWHGSNLAIHTTELNHISAKN